MTCLVQDYRERRNHGNTEGFGSRMSCEKRKGGGTEWLTRWTSKGLQGEAYDQTSSPLRGYVC